MNTFELIKELLNHISIDSAPFGGGNHRYKHSKKYDKKIYIHYKNARDFNATVAKVWEENPKLKSVMTFKKFDDLLLTFLEDYKFGEERLTEKGTRKFIEQLMSAPEIEWDILKPLFGGEIANNPEPIKFGPFVVYDVNYHKELLTEKFKGVDFEEDLNILYTTLLISTTLKASYPDKAEEFAKIKISEFENIIRYMIGISDIFNVSALESHSRRSNHTYIFSDENAYSNMKSQGIYSNAPLNEDFFMSKENGNFYIWEKLEKENHTEFDERLFRAVNWLGKGLKETDPVNALVEYMFALEALFTVQNGTEVISASIVHQLSESAAFVLGGDARQKQQYVKDVKKLYGRRSAIAHGRSNRVEEQESKEAFKLMKSIVIKLLTDPELQLINKVDDLQRWIAEKKYS